jgi:hypothetical protein
MSANNEADPWLDEGANQSHTGTHEAFLVIIVSATGRFASGGCNNRNAITLIESGDALLR